MTNDLPEPPDEWEQDGRRSADALGRALYAGIITCAVLAAVVSFAVWVGWL